MTHDTKDTGRYVLITAAYNEERFIGRTLESVVTQTVLPLKWVIVSDGSTDGTDQLVKDYAVRHEFITLVRKERDSQRNDGSKGLAIIMGVESLGDLDYDFIGALDADVSFDPDYYARVLAAFEESPGLGVAGGQRFDDCGGVYKPVLMYPGSAGGPTQFFRRSCYEAIGGYLHLPKGGLDAIAEVMARMRGWEVRTIDGAEFQHHRRTGTERGSLLASRYRQGIMEYSLGNHPLFEFAKCLYRMIEPPFVIGGVVRFLGYCHAALRGDNRAVSPDVVAFLRREQLKRLGLGRSARAESANP